MTLSGWGGIGATTPEAARAVCGSAFYAVRAMALNFKQRESVSERLGLRQSSAAFSDSKSGRGLPQSKTSRNYSRSFTESAFAS
jgi:hypothetical protein